jgi:hypothetical protein
MVKTNRAQRVALHKVFLRTVADSDSHCAQGRSYRNFRKTVQPGWGCIMVPFAGMWLGIEPDGYTHS